MAVCTKCVLGGVLQNGSRFDFEEVADAETDAVPYSLEFFFELDTDEEESRGQRKVFFEGRVSEGTVVDGVIEGTLSGQFDVLADNEVSAPATVETFARRGVLALITVSAQDDKGRTFFSANIRPPVKYLDPRRLAELRGTVFLGWDNPNRAAQGD
jgi:hypothetical protein